MVIVKIWLKRIKFKYKRSLFYSKLHDIRKSTKPQTRWQTAVSLHSKQATDWVRWSYIRCRIPLFLIHRRQEHLSKIFQFETELELNEARKFTAKEIVSLYNRKTCSILKPLWLLLSCLKASICKKTSHDNSWYIM